MNIGWHVCDFARDIPTHIFTFAIVFSLSPDFFFVVFLLFGRYVCLRLLSTSVFPCHIIDCFSTLIIFFFCSFVAVVLCILSSGECMFENWSMQFEIVKNNETNQQHSAHTFDGTHKREINKCVHSSVHSMYAETNGKREKWKRKVYYGKFCVCVFFVYIYALFSKLFFRHAGLIKNYYWNQGKNLLRIHKLHEKLYVVELEKAKFCCTLRMCPE